MVYQKDRQSLRPREVLAEEKKCIEDHAPGCQAACPLHLDARAMMAFVRKVNLMMLCRLLKRLPISRVFWPKVVPGIVMIAVRGKK